MFLVTVSVVSKILAEVSYCFFFLLALLLFTFTITIEITAIYINVALLQKDPNYQFSFLTDTTKHST